MSSPHFRGGTCTHTGQADAAALASLRYAVRDWVSRTVDLDAQRTSDIVLATCEALSNCAEHAYYQDPIPASMTLALAYKPDHATVEVTVSDHGRWLEREPSAPRTLRGRGLILMQALADTCTVTSTDTGTVVSLHFDHCAARTATF